MHIRRIQHLQSLHLRQVPYRGQFSQPHLPALPLFQDGGHLQGLPARFIEAFPQLWAARTDLTSQRLDALTTWVDQMTRLRAADMARPEFQTHLQFLSARKSALAKGLVDHFLTLHPEIAATFDQTTELEKDLARLAAIVEARANDSFQKNLLSHFGLPPEEAAHSALILLLNDYCGVLTEHLGERKTGAWFAPTEQKPANPLPIALFSKPFTFPPSTLQGADIHVQNLETNFHAYAHARHDLKDGPPAAITLIAMGGFFSWMQSSWATLLAFSFIGLCIYAKGHLRLALNRRILKEKYGNLEGVDLRGSVDFFFKEFFAHCQSLEKNAVLMNFWRMALLEASPLTEKIPSLYRHFYDNKMAIGLCGRVFVLTSERYAAMLKAIEEELVHITEMTTLALGTVDNFVRLRKTPIAPGPRLKVILEEAKKALEQSKARPLTAHFQNCKREVNAGLLTLLAKNAEINLPHTEFETTHPEYRALFSSLEISRLLEQFLFAMETLQQKANDYEKTFGFHPKANLAALKAEISALIAEANVWGFSEGVAKWNQSIENPDMQPRFLDALHHGLSGAQKLNSDIEVKLALLPREMMAGRQQEAITAIIDQYF